MYEGFTRQAIKAVMHALDAAGRLGYAHVTEETLLLGLLSAGSSFATHLLCTACNSNLRTFQTEVERIVGASTRRREIKLAKPGFSTPAKQIIDDAAQLARQRQQQEVTTEHLLLSLLRVQLSGETKVESILKKLGVDPNFIRYDLVNLLGKGLRKIAPECSTTTPTLDMHGVDLTEQASKLLLETVVARDAEIDRLVRILLRRKKPFPLLVGETGVGKSAVARGLAIRISRDDVPEHLFGRRVIEIDALYLLAQPNGNQLLTACLEEATKERILLVIDDIHLLLCQTTSMPLTAASCIFSHYVNRNNLCCVGIASLSELQNNEWVKNSLDSQFQTILVSPATVDQSITILNVMRVGLQTYHQLVISDEAIRQAVALSDQLIPDRFLPDKAINIIDEACVLVLMRAGYCSPLNTELRQARLEKENCIRTDQFERAGELFRKESELLEMKRTADGCQPELTVTAEDVVQIINESVARDPIPRKQKRKWL